MFMFVQYVLLLATLLSSVFALPLASRDVVDPPITSPTASSVWHVGQQQTVTWSTAGLPVNQTNPVGMLVLGYLYNNSENLMLNSPLATNLNYSVGQAQITVPNVPTGSDYIVVLFGDSGNASPEFTIVNDASSSTPVATTSAPTSSPDSSTPPPPPPSPTPPPPSPSPSSPGNSDGSSPAAALPAATTPALSQTLSAQSSSTVIALTASTTPSPTGTNAASQKRAPGAGTLVSVVLVFAYFAFS